MTDKKDQIIDGIQDVIGKASEVLPKAPKRIIDNTNIAVDIYQEQRGSELPTWKIFIIVSGSTVASAYAASRIEIPTFTASAVMTATGNIPGAFAIFASGSLIALKEGELTYDAVHALLTDVVTSDFFIKYEYSLGDALLEGRNDIAEFFKRTPQSPNSSAIDPLSNDAQYTLPEEGAPSVFPQSPLARQFTPLSSTSSAVVNEGGFFSSVGSFFSGIGSGITDFFGGGSDVGSTPFNPLPARGYERASGIPPADLMRHQLAQRQSPLDIDKILSDAVAKNADSLIDRLIAKNPNMFQKTLGRVLTSSLETFTSEIRKSKSRSLEEAFSNVFSGQSGQQFATSIGSMAAGEIINYGINEIFHKERTRVMTQETERSRQQRESLRLSEGQQAAALLRAIQKGQRNL